MLRTVGPLALAAAAFVLLLESLTLSAQAGTSGVWILVVKEHGVGSPTLVQPDLDRVVAIAAEQNGWADAKGQYYNNRRAAEVGMVSLKAVGATDYAALVAAYGK